MNSFIRQKFFANLYKIPISIPFFITIICVYGFIILYSAAGGQLYPWAYRQIIIFFTFIPVSLIIALIDTSVIYRFSYVLYFCTVGLLVIVAISGKTVMGATRWIDLGFFHIQPSEMTKISIVLMLARYFHNIPKQNISSVVNLIVPIIGIMVPVILVIKQPDLGTGVITIVVAIIIFFIAGVRLLYFVIVGVGFIILLPITWFLLHDYQKNRVLIFLDPGRDPLGAGYNIIQSKIAIGSGGFFGKGLLNGTQSHLRFLPEHTTDFVFAFLTEELGFIGGLVLLVLYFLLITSSLVVAVNSKSTFKKIVVIGVTSIFFNHIFVNIGMVTGIMPVVGVPLPFISYGGTMMVTMLISFGLVMNASVYQNSKI